MRALSLENARDLRRELGAVGADPESWPVFAAKSRSLAVKIDGLSTAGANILKQTALAGGADCAVHRDVASGRARRSSAIVFATPRQLGALGARLEKQPRCVSCLVPELAELAERLARPALVLRLGGKSVDLARRTYVMGILNVTPDSFSDGGRFIEPGAAAERALAMQEEGADFVDLGAESTRPGAEAVPAKEQLRRLLPVLGRLCPRLKVPVSVDTSSSRVAEAALDAGAARVNDVSALRRDPKLARLVARRRVACVLMHMQGRPRTMQQNPKYRDLMAEVYSFLDEALARGQRAGIERSQMVVDPGIGFGKTREHNLELLRRIGELRSLGVGILCGPSRKRFIGEVLGVGVAERVEGTLAAVLAAAGRGANIVRVHDVRAAVRALRLADAIEGRN